MKDSRNAALARAWSATAPPLGAATPRGASAAATGADHSARRVPDFLIAGQSKSGTTALHDMLAQHPQLFLSSPKEPNFLATDLCSPDTPGAFRQRTASEYQAIFSPAPRDALCGESSACCLYSTMAAKNLGHWNPEAKIIAILREPVEFLYSYYLQMLKNPITDGESLRSFRQALAAEPDRQAGRHIPPGQRVPQLLYYSERVKYREQLDRYLACFPPDQVLVLIYDDFREDNRRTLQQVCQFLNVSESFSFTLGEHNAGVKVRSKRIQNAIHRLSHGRGAWRPVKRAATSLLPATATRRAVDWAYGRFAFRPKGDIAPKFRRDLMRRFRGEVESVSELLGRDLVTLWRYDQI